MWLKITRANEWNTQERVVVVVLLTQSMNEVRQHAINFNIK